MGLTISNWGNVSTKMDTPRQNITSDDWAALGRGLGDLQKWSQRQKAADLMEGKATVQDRIKAIDEEIASLEAKLQGYEEQAMADAQAAENRAIQQQNMEGYSPIDAWTPKGPEAAPYPQQTPDVYQDQYLATQAATAQPNRSYGPYDRNARMNAEYGMNGYKPNFNGGYRWGR